MLKTLKNKHFVSSYFFNNYLSAARLPGSGFFRIPAVFRVFLKRSDPGGPMPRKSGAAIGRAADI